MTQLNGKVVLVNGGARGIGAAVVQAIIDNGGKVVIADLLEEEGAALAERRGATATYVCLDVTSPKLVVFPASGGSSFSTGAKFVIHGGENAGGMNGGSLSAMLGPSGLLAQVA